jgi:hypothetical protein
VPAVALVAAAAVTAWGCGTTQIDHAKAEKLIRDLVSQGGNTSVTSVSCPSGINAKAGTSFTCSVKLANGRSGTVTEHIQDSSGTLFVGPGDLHLQSSAPSGSSGASGPTGSGSSGTSGPSGGSFVSQANGICAAYTSQVRAVPPPANTASSLAAYLGRVVPLLQTAYQGLSALTPPGAQTATYTQFLAGLRQAIAVLQGALTAVQSGNASQSATLLRQVTAVEAAYKASAATLGLTSCS